MRAPVGEAGGAAEARPGVTLRPATGADVSRVATIERAAFSDPWSPSAFVSVLESPRSLFLVAEVGGELAGYAVAWAVVDEAEIANVAVAPPWRRRGVGAALLDAVLARLESEGARTVYLEVRDSNAAARALYESRGFAVVGRRRRYYRRPTEDALVMRRVREEDGTA